MTIKGGTTMTTATGITATDYYLVITGIIDAVMRETESILEAFDYAEQVNGRVYRVGFDGTVSRL